MFVIKAKYGNARSGDRSVFCSVVQLLTSSDFTLAEPIENVKNDPKI